MNSVATPYVELHRELVQQWNTEGPDAVRDRLAKMDRGVMENLLTLQVGAAATRHG